MRVISSQARLRPPNARRCRTIFHRSCTVTPPAPETHCSQPALQVWLSSTPLGRRQTRSLASAWKYDQQRLSNIAELQLAATRAVNTRNGLATLRDRHPLRGRPSRISNKGVLGAAKLAPRKKSSMTSFHRCLKPTRVICATFQVRKVVLTFEQSANQKRSITSTSQTLGLSSSEAGNTPPR